MTGIRIIEEVEEYIKGLYNKHSSDLLCYHSLEHAKEVVEVITELCDVMNISEIERENLIIAGWFHDVGYFETCSGHEELSAEYADRYLSEQNFSNERIKQIKANILATKVPTNPANIYEKIICDADLHHLGKNDIENRSQLFRQELQSRNICKISDVDWLENSLKFLNEHTFYTDYANEKFGAQKKKNIKLFEEKIKKMTP
jgi:uncharacterized protein